MAEIHIPRGSSITIAASDSLTPSADYVCDGTDDQVQFAAARDELAYDGTTDYEGGDIYVAAGIYSFSASLTMGQGGNHYVHWHFARGAIIKPTGDFNILAPVGGVRISGLQIDTRGVTFTSACIYLDLAQHFDYCGLMLDNILLRGDTGAGTGTAILFYGDTPASGNEYAQGVAFENIWWVGFEYGIRGDLNSTGTGLNFLNDVYFRNIVAANSVYFISFECANATYNNFTRVNITDTRFQISSDTVTSFVFQNTGRCYMELISLDAQDSSGGVDSNLITLDADSALNRIIVDFPRSTNVADSGRGNSITSLYRGGVTSPGWGQLLGAGQISPILLGADVILTGELDLRTNADDIRDMSGNNRHFATVNSPTFGTQGKIGKVTYNGTTQYAASINVMDFSGNRYLAFGLRPNFDWDDGNAHLIFYWQPDASNYIIIRKRDSADNNVLSFQCRDSAVIGNIELQYPFSSGGYLIIIAVIDDTNGITKLYVSGKLVGTDATGPTAITGTATGSLARYTVGDPWFWAGDIDFFAEGNYLLEAADVSRLTRDIANAMGLDFREFSKTDLFLDVLAEDVDKVVDAEDISGGGDIVCTIDGQPDVPRNLTLTVTDGDTSITDFTITVVGVDAKGNAAEEVWVFADGLTQTGDIAFATVTSVTITDLAGAGVGDLVDVGIGSKLGLSNSIYATGDVYKCTKNAADYSGAGNITPDTTYHTVDVSTGGAIGASDDFTLWYKSNLLVAL